MFFRSREFYDKVFAEGKKDYQAECNKLIELFKGNCPNANTLLDVACGTGEHDRYLKDAYQIHGIDIDETMLKMAKQKNPECTYDLGDMKRIETESVFDLVVCLFSSIGHLKTESEVEQAVRSMADRVSLGGLLVIEPWLEPSVWSPDTKPLHMVIIDTPELKYAKISHISSDGSFAVINDLHCFADLERQESFSEEMRLLLVDRALFQSAFERNGLEYTYDPIGLIGRGLHIGLRK